MKFVNKVIMSRKKQEKVFMEKTIKLVFSLLVLGGIVFAFSPKQEPVAEAVFVEEVKPMETETISVQVAPKVDSQTLVKQDIIAHNDSFSESEANNLAEQITTIAKNVGVSPELLACLFKQESNYDQGLENELGATGLGQITPVCQEHLQSRGHDINRYNQESNILGSAIYLKEMLEMFGGNERLALAAYNAGPGVVHHYGDVPPYGETQHYVKNIMEHKEQMLA